MNNSGKSITTSIYVGGVKTASEKASVTTSTHHTTKPKVVVHKGSHGWYGLSWTNVHNVWSLKKGTYKVNGHKYSALFNEELGNHPAKKASMNIGFKHDMKKAHSIKLSTKGIVTQ